MMLNVLIGLDDDRVIAYSSEFELAPCSDLSRTVNQWLMEQDNDHNGDQNNGFEIICIQTWYLSKKKW